MYDSRMYLLVTRIFLLSSSELKTFPYSKLLKSNARNAGHANPVPCLPFLCQHLGIGLIVKLMMFRVNALYDAPPSTLRLVQLLVLLQRLCQFLRQVLRLHLDHPSL